MVLMILFFSVMIAWACRRRRLQHVRRTGYVVIRGQSVTPGSVITTNNAQIAQVFENDNLTRPVNLTEEQQEFFRFDIQLHQGQTRPKASPTYIQS